MCEATCSHRFESNGFRIGLVVIAVLLTACVHCRNVHPGLALAGELLIYVTCVQRSSEHDDQPSTDAPLL